MEYVGDVDLVKLGAVGVMAFGAVAVVGFFKSDLKSKEKIGLHFLFFLVFSFVPAQLAGEVAQRIRDAVAGTLLVAGFYKGGKDIAKSIGGE